jgi:hypothetical protein
MTQELDTTLVASLRQLDTSINSGEDMSVRLRWDYARRILAYYLPPDTERKQLPKGVLDQLAGELGVCRAEVGARMKFARMYDTDEKLSTVIESFPLSGRGAASWSAIKQHALSDTTRTGVPKKTPFQRAFGPLDNVAPETLTSADLADIVAVFKVLKRHRDSILEQQRKAA